MGVVAWTLVACTSIEGGFCDQSPTDAQWYFITQSGATGTLKTCVLCNFSIHEREISDWLEENAGEEYRSVRPDINAVLPCVYVYVYGPGPFDTEGRCEALACSENPETNDAVLKDHHAGRTIIKERSEGE